MGFFAIFLCIVFLVVKYGLCYVMYTYLFYSVLRIVLLLQVECRKLSPYKFPLSPLLDIVSMYYLYIQWKHYQTVLLFLPSTIKHILYNWREVKVNNIYHFSCFSFTLDFPSFLLVSFPFYLKNFLYHLF